MVWRPRDDRRGVREDVLGGDRGGGLGGDLRGVREDALDGGLDGGRDGGLDGGFCGGLGGGLGAVREETALEVAALAAYLASPARMSSGYGVAESHAWKSAKGLFGLSSDRAVMRPAEATGASKSQYK